MGVRATGLQSFKHVILFFFGMGTMVDFFKLEGTTDRERETLNMSIKISASWNAHAQSTQPGMPSEPTALRIFTRGKDRITFRREMESALTSSAAATGVLSVWAVLLASKRAKQLLSSSGREAAMFTVADLFPLKPVMLLMPCHMLLVLLVLNCSSTLFLYCHLAALMDFQ